MLRGIDISHHNEAVILKNPAMLRSWDFVIMKASEGLLYNDSKKARYLSMISKYQGIGFYHYARPEINKDPTGEVDNFLSSVGDYYLGQAILALDVEADALLYPDIDDWVYDFCKQVYEHTEVKPVIYCSESQCFRFKKACDFDCGLWCARWGDSQPRKSKIKPWKFWAIWQNQTGANSLYKVDTDIFNGDINAWFAYAKGDRA